MTPLTINTGRGVDGTPLVTAAGEIDISNIHVFTEALTSASEGNGMPITVDMSAVKYLDSAGVNVLFKHADEIERLHHHRAPAVGTGSYDHRPERNRDGGIRTGRRGRQQLTVLCHLATAAGQRRRS